MREKATPEQVCKEISGELREMAGWLANGELSPEQLRSAVVTLESKKVARFGFRLESAVDDSMHVKFSLRQAESGELCASMDVDPRTG